MAYLHLRGISAAAFGALEHALKLIVHFLRLVILIRLQHRILLAITAATLQSTGSYDIKPCSYVFGPGPGSYMFGCSLIPSGLLLPEHLARPFM